MEPEGMRNGSTRNERIRNTIRITGKKARAYSTKAGSLRARVASSAFPAWESALALRSRFSASSNRSSPQIAPVPARISNMISAKSMALFLVHAQNGEKRLLRDFYGAQLFHAFLALFLFFQQFALARGVAAIAFGRDILAQRLDRFARDDLGADGRLDGDVEHLPRDQFAQFFRQFPSAVQTSFAMHDHRQRVHFIAIDQHVKFTQVGDAKLLKIVVERGITAAHRLQPVEEIEHDFVQRQFVDQHGLTAVIGHVLLDAAFLHAQSDDIAHILLRHEDSGADDGLAYLDDYLSTRRPPPGPPHRQGCGEIQPEFAHKPLLNDLQMQQAEEAAAETET